MDIKSSFLNVPINEKVYVSQPLSFEDHDNPNHVFKFKRSLYSLKQPHRAWYERLNGFFIKQGFNRGKFDTTLFIRHNEKHILLVKIYVYDIIFGSTNETLCREFASLMHGEFEMSFMKELTYFLEL